MSTRVRELIDFPLRAIGKLFHREPVSGRGALPKQEAEIRNASSKQDRAAEAVYRNSASGPSFKQRLKMSYILRGLVCLSLVRSAHSMDQHENSDEVAAKSMEGMPGAEPSPMPQKTLAAKLKELAAARKELAEAGKKLAEARRNMKGMPGSPMQQKTFADKIRDEQARDGTLWTNTRDWKQRFLDQTRTKERAEMRMELAEMGMELAEAGLLDFREGMQEPPLMPPPQETDMAGIAEANTKAADQKDATSDSSSGESM